MTASGLERIRMCWKNVCLFVLRQVWRADLTQVSSSAWPRGRLTPEWGWVRKCLPAFNLIKLAQPCSSGISGSICLYLTVGVDARMPAVQLPKTLELWHLKIFESFNFVSHGSGRPPWVGFYSTFNLITCWPRVHLYVLPVRVEHFMEFERKIYSEIPEITNPLFLKLWFFF